MTTLSEKILLSKIRINNDPEAFGQLYDFYVKRIYRFVYFKVRRSEDAEDITADVFLKAWNFLQEKKEVKSFSGLLYRIARNCVIDLYRRRANQPEVITIDENGGEEEKREVGDQGIFYEKLDAKLENENLLKVLKKLKQEYQEVITLKYIDELTIEEIAEIVGKSKLTVRVTIHRALKKIKELVETQL